VENALLKNHLCSIYLAKQIAACMELITLNSNADSVVIMHYGLAVKFIIVINALGVKEKKIHARVLIFAH